MRSERNIAGNRLVFKGEGGGRVVGVDQQRALGAFDEEADDIGGPGCEIKCGDFSGGEHVKAAVAIVVGEEPSAVRTSNCE